MEYGLWRIAVGSGILLRGFNPCSNGIWSLTCPMSWSLAGSFCLNPCSNGIWSLTDKEVSMFGIWLGLNPCSNGICSLTEGWQLVRISGLLVLILVLMEYGLWLLYQRRQPTENSVLILVLMEYGLWRPEVLAGGVRKVSLNPCSNGIWSLTRQVRSRTCLY